MQPPSAVDWDGAPLNVRWANEPRAGRLEGLRNPGG
jgi:hypothetical protein